MSGRPPRAPGKRLSTEIKVSLAEAVANGQISMVRSFPVVRAPTFFFAAAKTTVDAFGQVKRLVEEVKCDIDALGQGARNVFQFIITPRH